VRLRQSIPAGLADAGLASLATFVIALFAARRLSPAELGCFSLFFSTFVAVTLVPSHLLLTPAEIHAARRPAYLRLGSTQRSLALALPWAVGSGAVALAAVPLVPPEVPAATVWSLAFTTGVAGILSPLQDHVRRMLHIAQRSWAASAVSGVQLAVAILAVVALIAAGVPDPAVPFTALALANAASLMSGAGMIRGAPAPEQRLNPSELIRSGRWLLLVGVLPAAAGLISATVVGHQAGATALGYSEAARVVAQPLLVVSTGLGAVLGPRLLASASVGEEGLTRRYRRLFAAALFLVFTPYGIVVSFDWPGNPAAALLPAAYVVPGLVLVTVAANLLNGLAFSYRYELVGRGRERALATGEGLAGLGQVAVSTAASLLGAVARPLALAAMGLIRIAAFASVRSGEPEAGAQDWQA
jgi:O-antigen/teichoic acid export membrane protein